MRNAIFAITLDGCCGHTSTIADDELLNYCARLIRDVDLFGYGRKTYQLRCLVGRMWQRASQQQGQRRNLLERLTASTRWCSPESLKSAEDRKTRTVRTNLRNEMLKLKQEPGKNILCGGVDVPSQRMGLGPLDEHRFVVQPIIAGEGRRLLEGARLPEKITIKTG